VEAAGVEPKITPGNHCQCWLLNARPAPTQHINISEQEFEWLKMKKEQGLFLRKQLTNKSEVTKQKRQQT